MKIRWSTKAQNDYDKILQYLKKNWSLKEIQNFMTQTERVLNTIQNNPKIFIESPKRKNVRKGFISKHNSLFYLIRPRKKEIILLTFWDNRQNPSKSTF